MVLQIQQAKFKLHKNQYLNLPHFSLQAQQFCIVVGGNGSGKTAFSLALKGDLPIYQGHYDNQFRHIELLSFEKQQRILEQTFKDRNSDHVDPNYFGETVVDMLLKSAKRSELIDFYVEKLRIQKLLTRPFIQLSTGESRKVLLAQMLLSEPDLVILDEPFEGLDYQSVQDWKILLKSLSEKMAIVLILNRFSDMAGLLPTESTDTSAKSAVDFIAVLDQQELILQGSYDELREQSLFQQLQYAELATEVPIPAAAIPVEKLPKGQNPFELRDVRIQYGEKMILDKLSWIVEPYQHWWVKGPNGAGKSTLLSVLTGDHPQSFANDVKIFGRQRGSGETIWEIKQKIGYVSSQLHMDYRVNCPVIDVILSGFFDSIGVYQKVPEALRIKAMEWLSRLKLEKLAKIPFRSLSWGQQRLLLIARAMVKYPPILILDEPLQGLDGVNRKLVKEFIGQLVKNSETQLIFVSHQEQDAPNCITHKFEFIPQNQRFTYIQSAV
ncbi:MAG: molybdate ABC transporter ATP-binding protein ModF [Lonepinella koalarum]|nr:molybdate ABC transporter ATP-binding protein ModF [Lonepinella koalarum]